MDNAGRLLIAPVLRQHAGLTKEVMLFGQFNKFELWDENDLVSTGQGRYRTLSSLIPRHYRTAAGLVSINMMENYKHKRCYWTRPVNGLNIRPDGIYIDGTLVAVVTRV